MGSSSILVLGAGELGMAVLRHVAQRTAQLPGTALTVLLRPATLASEEPAKQRKLAELQSLGIQFLPGDLAAASPAELAALFADFHTVIGCTGFVGGRGTQLKLARAVLDAGVARYIPWQFGVDYDLIGQGSAQDLFDEQLDVRDLLRSQDRTHWVIISTGMFTSFLFEPAFGVVDLAHATVRALGDWDTAVTVTTPEDVGRLTAAILLAEPPFTNCIVYTAGDTVSYGQLADVVESVLGRKVQRERWSVPHLKQELAQSPDDEMRKYRVVFAEGVGVAWERARTFNFQQGIEVVDVAQWLREHAPGGSR